MAKNSYYLIADPRTRLVVRRSHKPAKVNEPHLMSLAVGKSLWETYRAGFPVHAVDLEGYALQSWIKLTHP